MADQKWEPACKHDAPHIGGVAKSTKRDNGSRTSIIACDVRYLAFFLSRNDDAAFNVTMSFGYSVGDSITIIQLANKIRERFVDAPEQFKATSDE